MLSTRCPPTPAPSCSSRRGSIYFPEQRVDPASQEPEEAAPPAAGDVLDLEGFRKATRPAAEPGEITTILMQGVHTLIFEGVVAVRWQELRAKGATDEEIETAVRGAFLLRSKGQNKFGFSEAVGMNGDGPVDYAGIDCTMEPLAVMTGKGKKRQKLEGEQLVQAVRSMLLIPEVSEPDAQAAVEFAAAAAKDDDLFGED